MPFFVRTFSFLLVLLALGGLQACGGDPEPPTAAESPAPVAQESETAVEQASESVAEAEAPAPDTAAPEADAEEQVIDPDELEPAGEIELKQYTVAWVGSGTMGGGTLIYQGKEYPFRLAGLGVGGYGASSIDATGVVYNLPSLEDFPGTYGNARLGMTGGDSGGGKLWLRDQDGVVIELESKMRGLALAGGVDGILIQWEDEEDNEVDHAMDDTRDAAGEAIEAGADAVQDGVDKVKGWLKKN